MKRLKNELNALVNRGVDRHLRLAVTGLSRSGKTAFITAMVNQLLNIHAGARLPLLSAVREERLLGVKRIPQRDFGIPRFTYDEGLAQLYGDPPAWPTPTRGVSEIRLALRYKSNDSLLRHFKDTSTLYLEIVDYPGEWLLDLPMLAQDYLSWSRQMTGLLNGQRGEWSAKWRMMCEGLDPLAPADEKPTGRHCRRVDRLSPPLQTAGAALYSARTLCFAWRYGRSARAAILPMARCRCLGRV
ncbi:putative ATP-binding protein [Escherichia coli]|uniref:Putative ATP-binding protein n=1 Tax=Escherichia coli TaxID=562 RepID=A0A376W6F0_ECOLX|nr:putative ATP-binding protein [Escherichia coli]